MPPGVPRSQELSNDEIDRAIEAAADRFETVTLTLRGAALPAEPPPSSWVACDRCGKWRRLPAALDDAEGEKWYCLRQKLLFSSSILDCQ